MFFRKKYDYSGMLKKHLDQDFTLTACGKDAPGKKVIKAFEKEFKMCLPEEFKAFSTSPLGGIYIDVKESIWPRPKELEVAPFWSFLYAVIVYGFAKDIPDWMNIRREAEEFNKDVNPDYFPFLKIIGDADVYCFDRTGLIYRWDHELDEFNKIEMGFNELLEFEVSELKERKEQKKAGQE